MIERTIREEIQAKRIEGITVQLATYGNPRHKYKDMNILIHIDRLSMAICMSPICILVRSPISESRKTEMIFTTWDVHAGIGLEEGIRFESDAQGLHWHSVHVKKSTVGV